MARDIEDFSPQERRQIQECLDSLSRHPFREGHMRYRDNDGFECQIWFLGEIDVHYRVDHAVREVRVTVIERHPPLEP